MLPSESYRYLALMVVAVSSTISTTFLAYFHADPTTIALVISTSGAVAYNLLTNKGGTR
jgi:hypothetical protein